MTLGDRVRVVAPWAPSHGSLGTVVDLGDPERDGYVAWVRLDNDPLPCRVLKLAFDSLELVARVA